jgi:hypothetical protein
VGFLLPTLPQGAGREGARATARRSREEHQSRQGGGSVINWPPGSESVILSLRIRRRRQNSTINASVVDPDPDDYFIGLLNPAPVRIWIMIITVYQRFKEISEKAQYCTIFNDLLHLLRYHFYNIFLSVTTKMSW